MQQAVKEFETSSQNGDTAFDDLAWEMCCSAREVSSGFVPFANLDFTGWQWRQDTAEPKAEKGA
jgi:hypothetical protein